MMVLNGSYRAPLSYSNDILDAAERGLDRLRSAMKPAPLSSNGAPKDMLAILDKQSEATQQGFCDAMDDDFNTSGALANLFELVRTINTARDAGATAGELKPGQDTLVELTSVLGLRLSGKKSSSNGTDKFIELLIDVRTEARKQKNWILSDLIRDRLKDLSVFIEDGKDGTTWHS
jgi:cysteinyl-tRNA synthetase